MSQRGRSILIGGAIAVIATAFLVLTYPSEANHIEIDPDRLRERRSQVWLGITISTEVTETWVTPRLPAAPDRWITVHRSFFSGSIATRPELEPIDMIGRFLDTMHATEGERSQIAAEISSIVSRGISDWQQTRKRLAYAALPPEAPAETVQQLRERLERTSP